MVDDIESLWKKLGTFSFRSKEGLFGKDHIHCDLGSLVQGLTSGRASTRS